MEFVQGLDEAAGRVWHSGLFPSTCLLALDLVVVVVVGEGVVHRPCLHRAHGSFAQTPCAAAAERGLDQQRLQHSAAPSHRESRLCVSECV